MQEFWYKNQAKSLYAIEDGEGAVVVMLHGGMANHLAAVPFVAPLSARYRVVTPDLRGSGRSFDAGPLGFDLLADDVAALLDHLGAKRAVVGGASGGSGVALRFALRHPDRAAGLVLVMPVYAGEARGYTPQQAAVFGGIGALASRALAEGVGVLRPLYDHLPPGTREQALAMIEGFDPASVVATGQFLASGAQPFATDDELRTLSVPTLIVPGADPLHPPEVSDLYAAAIPGCTVARPPDAASEEQRSLATTVAIGEFCDRRAAWLERSPGGLTTRPPPATSWPHRHVAPNAHAGGGPTATPTSWPHRPPTPRCRGARKRAPRSPAPPNASRSPPWRWRRCDPAHGNGPIGGMHPTMGAQGALPRPCIAASGDDGATTSAWRWGHRLHGRWGRRGDGATTWQVVAVSSTHLANALEQGSSRVERLQAL